MRKPIILASAFAWAAMGAHGADEGYTRHTYNPGGSHLEEHASHNYTGGASHHEGPSHDESGHHAEPAAEEKQLAASFNEFVENALGEAERIREENKEIFAGGTPATNLGFKNGYEAHEAHGKLGELINILKSLKEILK
jgi:hypothetical protein